MKGILIALVFLSACNNPPARLKQISNTSKSAYQVKKHVDTFVEDSVIAHNPTYIDFNTAKINGVIPMISNVSSLYKSMGKPDSITTPDRDTICSSFYNKPFKYIYLKGSIFELYGNIAVVSRLSFEGSGTRLVSGNLIFDNHTTLNSLTRIFPAAVKKRSELLIEHNRKVISIQIPCSKKDSDDSWLLMFEKGKLIRMEYYMPC